MTTGALVLFSFLLLGLLQRVFPLMPLVAIVLGATWGLFYPAFHLITPLAKTVLIFFLFVESARLSLPKMFRFHCLRLPLYVPLLSYPLIIFFMWFFFAIPFNQGALYALPLLILDSRTIPAAFHFSLPQRIEQAFIVEGSLTTLLATLPLLFLTGDLYPSLIAIPIGASIAFAWQFLARRQWGSLPFVRGTLFLLPFALYALWPQGGFVAIIAAGLTLGHTARPLCSALFDFSRKQGHLLHFMMLFFLAMIALPTLTFKTTLYSLTLLFIIRAAATFLTHLGAPTTWRTSLLFSLLGPKGAIAAALTLITFPTAAPLLAPLFLSCLLHPILALLGTPLYATSQDGEFIPTVPFPEV